MGKMILELQTGYIADVIIDVKKKRFGEDFVSLQDCLIVRQLVQQRINRKGLSVKIVDGFFEEFFEVQNGVIIKNGDSLKKYICNKEIRDLIYDEQFIYLCICEIMLNKLDNSIEHTCATCNNYCCGGLSHECAVNCGRWKHDFNEERKISLRKILELK